MTFNSNIPDANESPGLFPAQANVNFGRLKTIISGDHVFNDSTQPDDGCHNQMTMVNRMDPTELPAGTNAIQFSKLAGSQTQDYFYNGDTIQRITPIVAMVNFDGTGAVGAQTMRSQFNVSAVQKTGTGRYVVNFITPAPDNNYVVAIAGMRTSTTGSSSIANGQIAGGPTYSISASTTFVSITFNDTSSSLVDVLMGNVIIYSFT